MPNTLTPEQLAELNRLLMQAQPGRSEMSLAGRNYIPQYTQSQSSGGGAEGGEYYNSLSGWMGYDFDPAVIDHQKSRLNGTPTDYYNLTGEHTGSGVLSNLSDHNSAMDWGPFAMAAIPFALAAAGVAAGAAGAGTGAGLGGGGAVAGDAFLPGALGAGYEGGALTGLEAYAAGGGGLGATGAGVDSSLLNGLNGSDLMSDAFVSNGGYGAGGFGGTNGTYLSNLVNGTGSLGSRVMGGTGAGGTGGTGGSLLSSLGGNSNLLGTGASLIGGLLGSQGQQGESSSTRDVPEWLKPAIAKQLGYAGTLLDQQMAPGYLQGYQDMRNVGQGLLNQPVAGNGFSRFFPGR